jgi:hypothetical protein
MAIGGVTHALKLNMTVWFWCQILLERFLLILNRWGIPTGAIL